MKKKKVQSELEELEQRDIIVIAKPIIINGVKIDVPKPETYRDRWFGWRKCK